jgi:hypothetical protein
LPLPAPSKIKLGLTEVADHFHRAHPPGHQLTFPILEGTFASGKQCCCPGIPSLSLQVGRLESRIELLTDRAHPSFHRLGPRKTACRFRPIPFD